MLQKDEDKRLSWEELFSIFFFTDIEEEIDDFKSEDDVVPLKSSTTSSS